MSNELDQVLSKAIEKGIEMAEKTGEFVIDQAPDLIQQFYHWHIAKESLVILVCITIAILFIKIWNKFFDSDEYEELDEGAAIYLAFMVIILIISFIISISALLELLQIIIAPKLYLIEYFIN